MRPFVLLAIALGSANAALSAWDLDLAERARLLLGEDDHFAAAIVQDGRLVPVRNGEIRLRAAGFAIVIVTPEPAGLLVNASASPGLSSDIRAGRPLVEILDEPDMFMGMAEYYFNEERSLYVSDVYPHYLFFSSADEHRYDFVHIAPGAVIGYRTVEQLVDIDSDATRYPVAGWPGPLYLSFVSSYFDQGRRVELQRAAALLRFDG